MSRKKKFIMIIFFVCMICCSTDQVGIYRMTGYLTLTTEITEATS